MATTNNDSHNNDNAKNDNDDTEEGKDEPVVAKLCAVRFNGMMSVLQNQGTV